jgi:hypothetical protein
VAYPKVLYRVSRIQTPSGHCHVPYSSLPLRLIIEDYKHESKQLLSNRTNEAKEAFKLMNTPEGERSSSEGTKDDRFAGKPRAFLLELQV